MAANILGRSGGSRSWRNNNPGNIEYGKFAKAHGAIGTDGRFAIFPTVEAGTAAHAALLSTKNYAGGTLRQAIYRWAPPSDNNNSAAYAAAVAKTLGVSVDTPMSQIDKVAMSKAQAKVEGWRAGTGGNAVSNATNFIVNGVKDGATLASATPVSTTTTGIGTPQMMGAPGQVAPIDIAAIMSQAGQLANQQIPNLPDIGQATNAYQASVQAALAQQLQNLDAQFAAGQKALTDRGAIFDQQRQQTLANVTSQGAQTQAALAALTGPSTAAQAAQDAAQNAGRAGYGFGALAGTTGGLQNVASAGAQQIAGATSDMQKMMEQDMANIGKLIQTQGANDLTLGSLQMKGAAQQQAATAVSNYIASMNAERVKALTDYALSTPQRQQQFASLLMGGAQSNQDAQSKNVSNAMAVQQNNTNNYNDFLKLQAQLADSAAGRAASLADSAAGRAQSQFNADRAYALDLKQFNQRVAEYEAKVRAAGADGIAGLSAKDSARVATAASVITPTIERLGDKIITMARDPKQAKNLPLVLNEASTNSVAVALAISAYDSSKIDMVEADNIMQALANASAQGEGSAGYLPKGGVAKRAAEIYDEMRKMYDNIALTDIPQARALMLQAVNDSQVQRSQADAAIGGVTNVSSYAQRLFGRGRPGSSTKTPGLPSMVGGFGLG